MAVTLCSVQDVLDRCGLNASSWATASTALVERLINNSEQTIVLETRRDWVNSYASLASGAISTLKICTASHAAIRVINYDMSGYTTRAESITMLNVNWEDFNRTLNALKNLDSVKIRSVA